MSAADISRGSGQIIEAAWSTSDEGVLRFEAHGVVFVVDVADDAPHRQQLIYQATLAELHRARLAGRAIFRQAHAAAQEGRENYTLQVLRMRVQWVLHDRYGITRTITVQPG